ncbi:MAG: hypothetical protein ACRC2T_01395, partial [Thermoguttaceae bacterium]
MYELASNQGQDISFGPYMVRDQSLTATYSGGGSLPATQNVTVVSVGVSGTRWTKKEERGSFAVSFAPSDLDKTNITLSGDTNLFDFFEQNVNAATGETTESQSSLTWQLPYPSSSISLIG